MPPMITAAILATEHDLDPPLATLMVAVGLVISFARLTGWWRLMRGRVIKPPDSIFEKRPRPLHPFGREESDSNRA